MDFRKLFLIAVLAGSTAIALVSQAWAGQRVLPLPAAASEAKPF
ncbi:hypothetical protein [Leisingera sp. ANG-Vp]|nr:hypothetical protein [Leisingera sp. ANG-Vp]